MATMLHRMSDKNNTVFEGHEIPCLRKGGVWAQFTYISPSGEFAAIRSWIPLSREWTVRIIDLRRDGATVRHNPGWGSRLACARKFRPEQLLFMASKEEGFDYYGNMECVRIDLGRPLAIDNVTRGRVERKRKVASNQMSQCETEQYELHGETFVRCAYPHLASDDLNFDVSTAGRIRTFRGDRYRYLLGGVGQGGYRTYRGVGVHVLVKTTFDPLTGSYLEHFGAGGITVDHVNRNRRDNALKNLEYAGPLAQASNRGDDATTDNTTRRASVNAYVERAAKRHRTAVQAVRRALGIAYLVPQNDDKLSHNRGWYDLLLSAMEEGRSLESIEHRCAQSTWKSYIGLFFKYFRLEDVPTTFWGDVDRVEETADDMVRMHGMWGSAWSFDREQVCRERGMSPDALIAHGQCPRTNPCELCERIRAVDAATSYDEMVQRSLGYYYACLRAGGPPETASRDTIVDDAPPGRCDDGEHALSACELVAA